jgi:hypothetical protein
MAFLTDPRDTSFVGTTDGVPDEEMTVSTMNHDLVPGSIEGWFVWRDGQVAEVQLLLPGRLAAELEGLAHSRGLTVGQLIRLLIRDHLGHEATWTGDDL